MAEKIDHELGTVETIRDETVEQAAELRRLLLG
jgi:hypothetical protein